MLLKPTSRRQEKSRRDTTRDRHLSEHQELTVLTTLLGTSGINSFDRKTTSGGPAPRFMTCMTLFTGVLFPG